MVSQRHRLLLEKINNAIKLKDRRSTLYEAMKRGRDARALAMPQLGDPQELRHGWRQIKEQAIANLDYLVKKFIENASKRGAHVYLAKDGHDAVQYILDLSKTHGVKLVAKSKSLTSEEIELNHPLEEAGIEVVETDLGERIIQLAGEKPYHLVYPAVHYTRREVAKLFSRVMGRPISEEFDEIMKMVREELRAVFLKADMGITGANIAVAETGTVVIETNEGNARLVTSIPKIHVAIVGLEKIVSTLGEALEIVQAHPVSATGQLLTNYVSFMSGRAPLGMANDGREFHVVLLDNGRLRMREDPSFREALYCIRCGACSNICPTYGVVGGHVFGHIYPGPIGIPWTAQVHGQDKAASFAPLCISCGLCQEICPVDIDIPMQIARVKQRDIEENGQLLANRVLEEYERIFRLATPVAPLFNWLMRRSLMRLLIEKLAGIDRRRPIPEVQRETFVKWFRKRRKTPAVSRLNVAYFVDFFANYSEPDLGKTVVDILESAGVRVELPPQESSGYPYIAYGDLEKAETVAAFNVAKLYELVRRGFDIISTEPTATYSLKISYPQLLRHSSESVEVANHTYEFFEYLSRLIEGSQLKLDLAALPKGKAGFHIPCHQRALSSGRYTVELLRKSGLEVQIIENGTCCGMAGSFGMKKGDLGYQLANAVGEPLFDMFLKSDVDFIVTESSVCKIHLEQGTKLRVVHPLKLIKIRDNGVSAQR